jgi:hypothetical protein
VHDNFWRKGEEHKFEEADCESEACPVMPVFHHFQTISIEVNFAVEIHIVECLHWDLVLPTIFDLIGLILEGKVVFDWATRIPGFLVLARREG